MSQGEHGATTSRPWALARLEAAATVIALPPVRVPLADAVGLVLAADVLALTDLPAFPTSAMDGWAVAGDGPWRVVGEVLAGRAGPALADGEAVRIATGAVLPARSRAVLRRERGLVDGDRLEVGADSLQAGTDIRQQAAECRAGEPVAARGTRVTPVHLGLMAAAGHDTVTVGRRPAVDVLVLGDELLAVGPSRGGRVRDALGPMLPGWLAALGADVGPARPVADTRQALDEALAACPGDLVVTTGSTARGPVDHLHAALVSAGGHLVVDGVRVRPGHPMLLATLADGRPLVGLPGNPLAAVSALLTLAEPVLRGLLGAGPAPVSRRPLADPVTGHPEDTRLVPVRAGRPVRHTGPAMLRGLAEADAMAVIPPGGSPAGGTVEVLDLPW